MQPVDRAPARELALFALGFRPFFLMAGVFAVVLMVVWVLAYVGGLDFATYYGTIGWHSHELIFGFSAAVIAGFLLTAVRTWTEVQTAGGSSLAGMAAFWLAGRLLPIVPLGVPGWLIAVLDLSFLPVVAVSLAIPLLRGGQKRNLIFLPLLGAMALANLLVHLELLGYTQNSARAGNFLGLDLIVLLIVIMGGRVIPFFTERALAGVIPRRWPVIEWLSASSAMGFLLAELIFPDLLLTGGLAALAAVSNGVRLIGWYTSRFWSAPLLWVLHLGYAWIVAGFCLKALASAGAIAPQFTIHAFTVGGIGALTLGMMARVSLGHTGRPLTVAKPVAFAFVLINFAAAARGILPILFPEQMSLLVAVAGGLWIAAFAIFSVIYTPVLILPRVDGRPG